MRKGALRSGAFAKRDRVGRRDLDKDFFEILEYARDEELVHLVASAKLNWSQKVARSTILLHATTVLNKSAN
jgi:hypothetical protein